MSRTAAAIHPPHDTLGCLAASLHADQEIAGRDIHFYRKRSDHDGLRPVETPASDRGYLLGLSLADGHRRRIYDGRVGTRHGFDAGSIYVRNFADRYRAELDGPFDFLLVELPRLALDRVTDEAGCAPVHGLNVATGCADPMLSALMRVLLPVLERPAEAGPLLVEQVALAIATRVADRFGQRAAVRPAGARRLSRSHEATAKSMLHGGASIAATASACDLSRGYFTAAFRETVGQTPHQWVLSQRVQRARELLASPKPMPLAEVAVACGFADQSHFTRVFARSTGLAPAQWRRSR